MDNKGNQNKNGKNPRGQNYAVLIMTMLFTLLCVAMMHNLWQQPHAQDAVQRV